VCSRGVRRHAGKTLSVCEHWAKLIGHRCRAQLEIPQASASCARFMTSTNLAHLAHIVEGAHEVESLKYIRRQDHFCVLTFNSLFIVAAWYTTIPNLCFYTSPTCALSTEYQPDLLVTWLHTHVTVVTWGKVLTSPCSVRASCGI
jgi:hypothetical protein